MNKTDSPYKFDHEDYPTLRGPDGWECVLTEPEDRIWSRDLKEVVDKLNDYYQAVEFLKKEYKKLHELNKLNSDSAVASAHVVIEHSDFPANAKCRCEECKAIAIAMDDVGYADNIEDRWWEDNKEED